MSKNNESQLLINLSAADYAFHAGQVFAELLTDRAFEKVRQAGEKVVTVAHVANIVNSDFVEDLQKRLAEMRDGRANGKNPDKPSPDSRKAA